MSEHQEYIKKHQEYINSLDSDLIAFARRDIQKLQTSVEMIEYILDTGEGDILLWLSDLESEAAAIVEHFKK